MRAFWELDRAFAREPVARATCAGEGRRSAEGGATRHLCWGGPAVCRGRGHARPPGVPASGSAPLSSVWAAGLPGVASWGGTGSARTSLELL